MVIIICVFSVACMVGSTKLCAQRSYIVATRTAEHRRAKKTHNSQRGKSYNFVLVTSTGTKKRKVTSVAVVVVEQAFLCFAPSERLFNILINI